MCLAVPGKLISMTDDPPIARRGRVDFAGTVKDVSLAFVPDAKIGDYVLVHVGFAITRVSETDAQGVFDYLNQIGEVE